MSEQKKSSTLKFLHCADVHLDTPCIGLSPEKSEERRNGLRSTFMRMMEYVRDGGVDYMLISGDLFNTECATNSTAELLIREFRNCPDTKFIIAPGRSDYYEDNRYTPPADFRRTATYSPLTSFPALILRRTE